MEARFSDLAFLFEASMRHYTKSLRAETRSRIIEGILDEEDNWSLRQEQYDQNTDTIQDYNERVAMALVMTLHRIAPELRSPVDDEWNWWMNRGIDSLPYKMRYWGPATIEERSALLIEIYGNGYEELQAKKTSNQQY